MGKNLLWHLYGWLFERKRQRDQGERDRVNDDVDEYLRSHADDV